MAKRPRKKKPKLTGFTVVGSGLVIDVQAIAGDVNLLLAVARTPDTAEHRAGCVANIQKARNSLQTLYRHDVSRESAKKVNLDWLDKTIRTVDRIIAAAKRVADPANDGLPLGDDHAVLEKGVEKMRLRMVRVRGVQYGLNNPAEQLSDLAQRAWDYVLAHPWVTAKEIALALRCSQAGLESRILPALRARGMQNVSQRGYFIPQERA
jgi:hypothetical protein